MTQHITEYDAEEPTDVWYQSAAESEILESNKMTWLLLEHAPEQLAEAMSKFYNNEITSEQFRDALLESAIEFYKEGE